MREIYDVEDMEDVTTADLLAYRQSLQHLAGSTQKRYLAATTLLAFIRPVPVARLSDPVARRRSSHVGIPAVRGQAHAVGAELM